MKLLVPGALALALLPTPQPVEPLEDLVDPRNAIEALFLGEGPLEARPIGCFKQGEMHGWPPGTPLRILVGSAVTDKELGHAAFGLCHIEVPEGLGPAPLMSGSGLENRRHQPRGLEPLSFKAVQAVYRARLTPGATRRQFEAAGLIHPGRSGSGRSAGAYGDIVMVDGGGGEIAIMKPLCPPALDDR